MSSYQVRAVNTAPDSENKIHDDTTAAVYGFRGGLVPGVTVYGYMTPPAIDHFGLAWLECGAMNVRFNEPVYDGETVDVEMRVADDNRLELSLGGGRATGLAWMERTADPPDLKNYPERPMPPEDQRPPASCETLAPGTVLGTLVKNLDLTTASYSAPLHAAIGAARLAHPAILLALANEIFLSSVALGPWIHVGSEIANFATAQDRDTLTIRGRVVDQYERKGHEFVVLDIVIAKDDRVIQHVRHTAIWQPRKESSTRAN